MFKIKSPVANASDEEKMKYAEQISERIILLSAKYLRFAFLAFIAAVFIFGIFKVLF